MNLDDFVQACSLICDDWQWFKLMASPNGWTIMCKCQHAVYDTGAPFLQPQLGLTSLYEVISNYHEENI